MRIDQGVQGGQASVEFVVIATSLVAALCLPWLDGLSPAEWLLGAVIEASVAIPAWLAVV
jgi:hypothetical protein